MSRQPGRGRYGDNGGSYDFPHRGSSRDGFDSQPSGGRAPYYEHDNRMDTRPGYFDRENPWQSRQDYRDNRSPGHYDYSDRRYDRGDPREGWGRGRWGKQRGGGKRVAKPEAPLVLSGIPHLDRSFTRSTTLEEEKNNLRPPEEPGMRPGTNNFREDMMNADSAQNSNPHPMHREARDLTEIGGFKGQWKDNQRNVQNISENTSESIGTSDLQLEAVDSEEEYDSIPPSNALQDNGALKGEMTNKVNPNTTANPAKIEQETELYYEALRGKEEAEKKSKKEGEEKKSKKEGEEKNSKKEGEEKKTSNNKGEEKKEGGKEDAEVLSASQVAKITAQYETRDEQRMEEEKQKKSEEEKAKEKEAEIQTAWSILHQYWNFITENPYDFNGWTYLLNHVESMDYLEAARSAFEGFLPLYPYCFAYWKKLSDMELKHQNRDRALGILVIGTECVPLCCDLWIPLIQTYITHVKENQLDPQDIRNLYEYALSSAGGWWHSSPLWEACINYEQHDTNDLVRVMHLYKRLLATPTKLYNKHWDHFLALVRDHHPRNLLSVEEYQNLRRETCEELKIKYTPSALVPPKSVHKTPQPEDKLSSRIKEKLVASYIKTHEHTEEEVEKRWKFEERIKRPYFHIKPLDRKQLKNWNDYLDFEINVGDPIRIIPLFERALVACALYEDVWCRYLTYLEKHVQDVMDQNKSDNGVEKSEKKVEKIDAEKQAKETSDECSKEKNDEGSKVKCDEGSKEKNDEGLKVKSDEGSKEIDECVSEKVHCDDVSSQVNSDVSVVSHDGKDFQCETSGDVEGVRDSEGQCNTTTDSSNENINEHCTSAIDSESLCHAHAKSVSEKTLDSLTIDQPKPSTYKRLQSELGSKISMGERVLKCPPLTPEWIRHGVSWEDVRQAYRRAVWIHCPSKPSLLMRWAEFEEMQGNKS